jgi:hypothetical protein
MRRARWFLLSIFALAVGCATTSEKSEKSDRPPHPIPPPSSGELAYYEAVNLGTTFLAERGYTETQFEGAEQLNANIWRIRFGKGPDGVLHLYYDGVQKTIIKAEEIQGIRGRPVTLPLVPPAKNP